MAAYIQKFSIAALLVLSLTLSGCSEETAHDDPVHDTKLHSTAASEHSDDDNNHEEAHSHDEDAKPSKPEIRQTGHHSHGAASLSLALDGEVLVVEFDSPLYNLVGFEHMPKSDAQTNRLDQAGKHLARPAELFMINRDAGCQPPEMPESVSLFEKGNDRENGDTHRDFSVEYYYTCSAPENLKSITVNLFDHFPLISDLDTVFLGSGIQDQEELTPARKTMKLTK